MKKKNNQEKEKIVEEKKPRKIKKILLCLLLILVTVTLILFIKSMITKKIKASQDAKLVEKINALEKTDYIFIEINPSLVITISKEKVTEVACLNEDCLSIYDDINVKDKSIEESVVSIFNLIKEKGFDTSNGIRIKTTMKIEINNIENIKIEIINEKETKELLKNIINSEKIKESNNDTYYEKLWKELKRDKDYGKIYECQLSSEELACYIKSNLVLGATEEEASSLARTIARAREIMPNIEGLIRVFKKFNLNIKTQKELGLFETPMYLYIDNQEFFIYSNGPATETYYNASIKCHEYRFRLTDINLLKPENVKLELDPMFNNFDDVENASSWCDDKYCRKIVYEYNEFCNEATQTIEQGELINTIYKICDLNEQNCREVTKEYYDYFDSNVGYILDYPICEPTEDGHHKLPNPGEICRYMYENRWTYDYNNWTIDSNN